VNVPAVSVVELDVDKVRVQLGVDGDRVGDGAGVQMVILLAEKLFKSLVFVTYTPEE
jgi:hypothetical protein